MPRIFRLSSLHSYKLPKPEEGRFLNGVTLDPLKSDQLLEIARSSYSDETFSQLVYSVTQSRHRTYFDEFFASFIENVPVESMDNTGITFETAITHQQPIRCLCFDTSMKSPILTAQEFKYYQGVYILGGVGVFKLYSWLGLSGNTIKLYLGKLAQYHLESMNPCLSLMVSIVQPESSWQLALGQIHVHKYSKRNCASVKFSVFDPQDFVASIFVGKVLKDIPHSSFDSFVELVGDLSYFK